MSAFAPAGPSPWVATPLIALASLLGTFGLSTVVELGGWLRTSAFLLAIVAISIIGTRVLFRSRVLPTVVGAITATLVLIPAFAQDDAGNGHLLPVPSAFVDLGHTLRAGIEHAATTPAPVDPEPAFVALATTAIIALFLLAEHIAVSWRAAATAGGVLVLPWLPAVALQHRVSTPMLLLALAAWLAAMALSRRGPSSERPPSVGAAATATLAALLAVVLVTPTALGGNGWGAIPGFRAPEDFDPATRLNLALDLRNSLTTGSQSTVMTYTVVGSRPDSFRLYALSDFDGTAWLRGESEQQTQRLATGGVLWPVEVQNWNNRAHQRIYINILALAERNLPLPVAPRTVAIRGTWYYDAEYDEVVADGSDTRGLTYEVITDLNYHNAKALKDAQGAIDAGLGDLTDPRYLEIAPSVDLERVQGLARNVTADATSRYEQALALQQYLRNPAEFTYDVSVSPSGEDSISTFLNDRAGYCVQFASTMVIMARSLGIPARLAVGFLGGKPDGDQGYAIRGRDAHAWPELYFPGRGWVRFEPTPAVQTGTPPRWADPLAGQPPVSQEVPDGWQQAPVVPDSPVDPGLPAAPVESEHGVPLWLWFAVGALILALAAAWVWRSRGDVARRAREGAEGAWEILQERLGVGMAWNATLTPREADRHVRSRMELFGYGLSSPAQDALTRLSGAVSDHRYAPHGSMASNAELMGWVDAVMADVDQARAAEATDRPVRDGGRSALQRGA